MTKKNWRKRRDAATAKTLAVANVSGMGEVERIRYFLDLAASLAGVSWSPRGKATDVTHRPAQPHHLMPNGDWWLGMPGYRLGPEIPVRIHHPSFGSLDLGYASENAVSKSRRCIGRMGLTHPLVHRFCDEYERLR